ncbi:hypothetical protein J6590_033742 [Homalodisca vitripennis]|nr:hypothetical protein J6590_033742 [Homalodisca vitripennis]
MGDLKFQGYSLIYLSGFGVYPEIAKLSKNNKHAWLLFPGRDVLSQFCHHGRTSRRGTWYGGSERGEMGASPLTPTVLCSAYCRDASTHGLCSPGEMSSVSIVTTDRFTQVAPQVGLLGAVGRIKEVGSRLTSLYCVLRTVEPGRDELSQYCHQDETSSRFTTCGGSDQGEMGASRLTSLYCVLRTVEVINRGRIKTRVAQERCNQSELSPRIKHQGATLGAMARGEETGASSDLSSVHQIIN